MGRDFCAVRTGFEAHPASCTTGTRSLSEVKRQERGANYLSPSGASLRIGWS
jgi:hypothetical protein